MTLEEMKKNYPVGTQVILQGDRCIIQGYDENETLVALELGRLNEYRCSVTELDDDEIELNQEPVELPVRAKYDAQVFVLAWTEGEDGLGMAVFANLQALIDSKFEVESDHIMEAISDPGVPVKMDGRRVLTFTSVEGSR